MTGEKAKRKIQVDQIGYRTEAFKLAVFTGEEVESVFQVMELQTGKTVFEGTIQAGTFNPDAGEIDAIGDFSKIKKSGTYFIQTEKRGTSAPFQIGTGIYGDIYQSAFRMFYLQRCGMEVKDAGIYSHPACHTGLAVVYGTNEKLEVNGGWHDAGDYGRYIVAGAKAVYDLFLTYEEMNPAEKKAGELLSEVRYELEWMLKMQREDGALYHKVTCASFPGEVMPEEETEELILSPVSITATADFAAVMARASVLYQSVDKEFAARCLEQAEKAMEYARLHQEEPGFLNPEGIVTGQYEDEINIDECLWGAAELYRSTKKSKYLELFKKYIQTENIPDDFGWRSVGGYAMYAYLATEGIQKDSCYQKVWDRWIGKVRNLLGFTEKDAYRVSLNGHYEWGSNLDVASNAMMLFLAGKLIGKAGLQQENVQQAAAFKNAAEEHLHYCLGRNPVSMSYVTGFGTDCPRNVHHRPSMAANKTMGAAPSAMPGMLVGGPNQFLGDPTAEAALKGQPPMKCYIDHKDSYSTNEITIYWNSPLVFLLYVFQ